MEVRANIAEALVQRCLLHLGVESCAACPWGAAGSISYVCVSASNRGLGQCSLRDAVQGVSGCGAVLKKQKQPKDFPFHLRNLIFMKEAELQ